MKFPAQRSRRRRAAVIGSAGLLVAVAGALGTGAASAGQTFGLLNPPVSVGGAPPCAVAFDSSTGAVYAAFQAGSDGTSTCAINAGGSGGKLVSINGDSATSPVSLDLYPTSLAVDPDTSTLYVGESSGSAGEVQVFQDQTSRGLTFVTKIAMPRGDVPYGIAVDPTNDAIYAASYNLTTLAGSVQLIAGATNEIAKTIPLPAVYAPGDPAVDPGGVGIDPVTHTVFVADGYGGVDMISEGGYAATPIRTATSNDDVTEIAVDPGTETVYAGGTSIPGGNGVLSVIPESTDSDIGDIPLTLIPAGMSVNSSTETVYVSGGGSNGDLDVLSGVTPSSDTVQQLGTYDGAAANDVAADSASAAIYLAQIAGASDSGNNTIAEIGTVPDAPQNVNATAGQTSATVRFTPPLSNGGSRVTSYTVTADDLTDPARGGMSQTGTASPVIMGGLSTGDRYTFTVTAANELGSGPPSSPSGPVTIGGVTITTTALPEAVLGSPYSATLSATGGTTPYTWSATGLPRDCPSTRPPRASQARQAAEAPIR